jgi:hypothetical protein
MTDLLAAAKEICDWLDERGIRSCIIELREVDHERARLA